MTCFQCTVDGVASDSVAVCLQCGALLCAAHFREARSFSQAGVRFGCPHENGTTGTRQPASRARD